MKEELICDYCGSTFDRESREIKRSLKLNRKNYCSRVCCGKSNFDKNLPKERRGIYKISYHSDNRRDDFTGFRELLRRAFMRKHEVNITLQDIVDVWTKQGGKCPYSGVKLELPLSHRKSKSSITLASLDRIDSSKGYIKGNIQIISVPMNYMKNKMSNSETVKLCKLISQHWNITSSNPVYSTTASHE